MIKDFFLMRFQNKGIRRLCFILGIVLVGVFFILLDSIRCYHWIWRFWCDTAGPGVLIATVIAFYLPTIVGRTILWIKDGWGK